jgi:radical SAM superfamily enzyme YgiQ (UPF0313 family)
MGPFRKNGKNVKILLVHPQNYLQRHSTGIYGRSLRYAPLTMPTLKALVPCDISADVKIVDEMVEDLDFSTPADLVGITAITGTAPRAYEIADRYRAKGSTVVLGGVHPTLLTEESLHHADAVVIGYAERLWPQLLRDFTAGQLQRVYEDPIPLDPRLIVPPNRSSICRRDYIGWGTVEMSRGCTNKCEFCISHRFHSSYICRPIGDVIEEIQSIRSKVVFFLDPNLIGNHEYAKEFFREFTKLRKWWVGCASLDIVDDPELLYLAAKSGCRGLLMGFESVRQETLQSAGDALHQHGILVQACFVFGFDDDDTSVFEEAAEYIIHARFDLPQISIYTPFPGTPIFEKMEKEGRILTRNWSLYNGQNVVFQPLRMTGKELEDGTDLVRKRTHAWRALSRRLFVKPLWVRPLVLISALGFRFYQYRIAQAEEQNRASGSSGWQ